MKKQPVLWVVEFRMGIERFWWGRLAMTYPTRKSARARCKRLRQDEGHVTRVAKYIRED